MSTFILTSAVLTALSLLLSSSPTVMMFFVISYAILLCGLLKISFCASWFSMLLFLIYVGGLMILFSYITSLTPNTIDMISTINPKILIGTFSCILLTSSSFFFIKYSPFNLSPTYFNSHVMQSLLTFKIYSSFNFSILVSLFFYLLLTLLISVYVVLENKGPIRNITK